MADRCLFSSSQVHRISLSGYEFVVHFAEIQKNYSKGFAHKHPYIELYCVLSGEAIVYYEDGAIKLKAGDMYFVSAGVKHLMENIIPDDLEYFVLIFSLKLEKDHENNQSVIDVKTSEKNDVKEFLSLLSSEKYLLLQTNTEVFDICDRISKEIKNRQFSWETVLKYCYYQLFVSAIRIIFPKKHEEESLDFFDIAAEATEYLHEHFSEEITLDSLGTYLHISPKHANRVFKRMYGCTFYNTLKSIRLVYAKKLILTTDLSLEIIAARTGFKSAQALSQAYKQQEGVTIRQTRKDR